MGVQYQARVHEKSPLDPTFRRILGKYSDQDQKFYEKELDDITLKLK